MLIPWLRKIHICTQTWKDLLLKEKGSAHAQNILFAEPNADSLVEKETYLYLDLDRPIAKRKGVRSCTQHPLRNYLTYTSLSLHIRPLLYPWIKFRFPIQYKKLFEY